MKPIKQYNGRKFVEGDFYELIERHIAGLSKNNVWLYTVEKIIELKSEKEIIRIVRWKARNDKKNKNIKYWQYTSSYNIRSSKEWNTVSKYVDDLINSDNISEDNSILISGEEYNRFINIENKINALNSKINELKTMKALTEIELNIFRKKIQLMKANVKDYNKTLNNFKNLIEKEDTTETDIHKFITDKQAYWLFGLEYSGIESEVGFPPEKNVYYFDIMLRRYDKFYDLVELKGPNENIFDKRTKRRYKPNKALSEAIGQVFTYLHICEITNLENILKPKAIIVIGKDKTDKPIERRIFQSYLNNVELITYTELLHRGEGLLNYIKSVLPT